MKLDIKHLHDIIRDFNPSRLLSRDEMRLDGQASLGFRVSHVAQNQIERA